MRPDSSAVALTGGPGTSMVYLARTGDSVIAIDLGWWRHHGPITAALRELEASPDQVTDVFLTHSHRDHIGAWRLVRRSRFHLAESEKPLLLGSRSHDAWVPRWAERVKPSGLPAPDDIDVRAFARDTTFVFERDTLYAFVVPGHTAGSTVYLFRGVLFLGDAATHTPWGGFGRARRGYSDCESRRRISTRSGHDFRRTPFVTCAPRTHTVRCSRTTFSATFADEQARDPHVAQGRSPLKNSLR